MRQKTKYPDVLAIGLLIALLVVAFFARSPYIMTVPHRDSGIFLKIGSDILHGKVLYQQTWDNKQPLLYMINALGLWLGNGSVWGVWGLELALLIVSFIVAYYLIRPTLKPFSSFAVITIAFLSVFPFMGGNYSEEYSLVFQMGILGVLFGFYLPDRRPLSRPLAAWVMGILAGFVFCIKQSYVDIPIVVLIFIAFLGWIEKDWRVLWTILLVVFGFLMVNVPVFLYFLIHGALRDYLIDAYLFNYYYSSMSFLERVSSVVDKLRFVTSHPYFVFAGSVWLGVLIAWLVQAKGAFIHWMDDPKTRRLTSGVALVSIALFIIAQIRRGFSGMGYIQIILLVLGITLGVFSLFLFLRNRRSPGSKASFSDWFRAEYSTLDWHHPGPVSLLFLGLLDFPIVLLGISISGKSWTHYYVTLFPAVILLLAGGIAYIHRFFATLTKQGLLNSILVGVLVFGSFPSLRGIVTSLSQPTGEDDRSLTAEYLKSVTTPKDTILVWGWESVIYFLAQREAPTRFGLSFAFYVDTPYLDEFAETLLEEVKAHPPAYIVDLRNEGMPFIDGRPPETCLSGNQMGTRRLADFLAFVCKNYQPDRDFHKINIYRYEPADR